MNIKLIGKSGLRVNFTDKLMTAYGGFSILARLFDRIGLEKAVVEMVPFKEISPNSTGVFAKILKLGLTTMAGGERFTHSVFLGDSNEIYEQTFGVKKIPKSITSVTRFFNRFRSWKQNESFSEKLWSYLFSNVIPLKEIKHDYLTFDSTVITRYGKQEGAKKGYNPKRKGRHSHHPLIAFLNRSKYVVNLWNRSGNCSSKNGIVGFAKQTLNRLDEKLEIDGFIADSGFYDIEFFNFADEIEVEFVVSTPMSKPIQNMVYKQVNWKDIDEGISITEFNFQHADKKWTKDLRYIVVRKLVKESKNSPSGKQLSLFPEEDKKVTNYRYGVYVTSSEKESVNLWRLYRLRADDENIIKENKKDFGLEGFSMNNFYSTEAAMLVRIMFYNIFNFFRSEFLSEGESRKTLHTLRSKYFIIPSVLGRDGKNPVLRLGIKKQNVRLKFRSILDKIDAYYSICNAVRKVSPEKDQNIGKLW